MNTVFEIVYASLMWLSAATGLSYKEVNVIIYYIVVPLGFLFLIDRVFRRYILSPCFTLGWILLAFTASDFAAFCDWIFDRSVDFLNSFSFLGWNYTVASVMICVVAPGLVFLVLFYFAFLRRRELKQR